MLDVSAPPKETAFDFVPTDITGRQSVYEHVIHLLLLLTHWLTSYIYCIKFETAQCDLFIHLLSFVMAHFGLFRVIKVIKWMMVFYLSPFVLLQVIWWSFLVVCRYLQVKHQKNLVQTTEGSVLRSPKSSALLFLPLKRGTETSSVVEETPCTTLSTSSELVPVAIMETAKLVFAEPFVKTNKANSL